MTLITCGNCGEKVHVSALDEHAAYQCVRIAMEKAAIRDKIATALAKDKIAESGS